MAALSNLTLQSPQISQLLTAEYEQQLKAACADAQQKGQPEPRQSLKLVTKITADDEIVYLTRSDGDVNWRSLGGDLKALKQALNQPEKRQLVIQEIIQKTLRFPEHHNRHLSLKEMGAYEWMQGADFQSFFEGIIVTSGNDYLRIVHAHEFSDGILRFQAVEVAKPVEGQKVSPFDDVVEMIANAYERAKANLQAGHTPKTFARPDDVDFLAHHKLMDGPTKDSLFVRFGRQAGQEQDPRVRIFQDAICRNTLRLMAAKLADGKAATGKESTEKKT